MGTITGATTVLNIQIGPPAALVAQGLVSPTGQGAIFSTPQNIIGFAADDIFTVGPLASVETLMGVDGILSAGFVYVQVRQMIALQADSPSQYVFDQWWAAMQVQKDAYLAQGQLWMSTIGKKWNLYNGALTQYHPIPDAKKLLQPRRHEITWQSVYAAPTPPISTAGFTVIPGQ